MVEHNNVLWGNIAADRNFWVLCVVEGSVSRPLILSAERTEQEDYTVDGLPEDVLAVFVDTDSALLSMKELEKILAKSQFDKLRIVARTWRELTEIILRLDRTYETRVEIGIRVEVCESHGESLRREILFSRQVPKN